MVSPPPDAMDGQVSDLDFGQLRRSSPQVRGVATELVTIHTFFCLIHSHAGHPWDGEFPDY